MDLANSMMGSLLSFDFVLVLVIGFSVTVFAAWLLYLALYLIAPIPRPSLASEKKYRTIEPDGNISVYENLPCWQDGFDARKRARQWTKKQQAPKLKYNPKHQIVESVKPTAGLPVEGDADIAIEPATLFMSLVVPAFNEEDRIDVMLQEAVEFLEEEYGNHTSVTEISKEKDDTNGGTRKRGTKASQENGHARTSIDSAPSRQGYEILVVSDGSTDKTVSTALRFAQKLKPPGGPQRVRVIEIRENRGKGGAVTHGMRHVRGEYALFADADGATKFEDLRKLVRECQRIEDKKGRGVAVGSRAHLVGSEAVVKRSFTRNLLMHSFHIFLRLLTPPATAAIRDTQCGFKLFSRASLPYIIPFMHSEGWIFDVEMLMLAESGGIPVVEVPVGWKEVLGSKLNVLWDSLGMAWGLAVLRLSWGMGIYTTDV